MLDRDPWLIVPNRADVEVVERDLIARAGGLVGGRIATFDELFQQLVQPSLSREIAPGTREPARPLVAGAARALLVRRATEDARIDSRSGHFAGYAESLAGAIGEAGAALLEPGDLEGELASVVAAYRGRLDTLGLWDRDALRRAAVERLTSDLEAWDGRPVLAYGFEDLTGAEWRLLEALAARGEVHVSLPYEPGRVVYESLSRTADDLAALADEVVQLPPAAERNLPASLAHLERHLFTDDPPRRSLDGAVRFLEGQDGAPRSSWSPRRCSSSSRRGSRPTRLPSSHRPSSRCVGRWRQPVPVSVSPSRSRRPSV